MTYPTKKKHGLKLVQDEQAQLGLMILCHQQEN
jgi:hypothetical protein